ncbi:phage protease [Sphingomonas sp.]|uniref:phage protease n=1 Tax=Sphingomonas sp. TaxID=28214 RepID=UPI002DD672E2|nr:phage protease [Sphingomonas sp.]
MPADEIALCAAIQITDHGPAPRWVHLLPTGAVNTRDGRGPYRIPDPTAVITASMPAGRKLVLDENHATDLAAPRGGAAPAHGWITELQARGDGIWGRVDWVDPESRIWKRYNGVSPVIAHRKDGTILQVLRASLTNTPNLAGLNSLHSYQAKSAEPSSIALQAQEIADKAIAYQSYKATCGEYISIAEAVTRVLPSPQPKADRSVAVALQAEQLVAKARTHQARLAGLGTIISFADAVTAVKGEI